MGDLVSGEAKEKRKKNKVVIVGFAPDSRGLVEPYLKDASFEVWGLNELYLEPDIAAMLFPARADRWFQLHGTEPPTVRDKEPCQNLSKLKCPVYMWQQHRDVPNSVVYPLPEVMAHFDIFGEGMVPEVADPRDRVYFTNSISWEIALAVMEGFEEIHLLGVNMAQGGILGGEYGHQRPSCEFFLGWARGAGIKLYLPVVSDLLMGTQLYGLDDSRRVYAKYLKRIEELEARVNQVRNDRINLQNQAQGALNTEHGLLGAREDAEYLYHLGPGNVRGSTGKEDT